MNCWPFSCFIKSKLPTEVFEIDNCKMADHVAFAKRVRKSLYYGDYSDASLPSLSVTDVAVEVLNSAVPPRQRRLDRKYAHSVARRAKISPCALMMGMLYAERLRQKDSPCTKTLSSSDIFLISIMVASKYLYDEGEEGEVYNEDWAKAGSKTVQDINKLEMEFLRMLDWNMFISKDEFSNFVSHVESRVAISKGLSRGWLTYHDMSVLLGNTKLLKILLDIQQQLFKSISTCLAAYVLGVSILLGSSSLATLDHTQANLSTTVHTQAIPTFNCLTTEASCAFTRNPIAPASDKFGNVFRPIAATRVRSSQRVQMQGISRTTAIRENVALNTTEKSDQHEKAVNFSPRKMLNDTEKRKIPQQFVPTKIGVIPFPAPEKNNSVDIPSRLANDTSKLPISTSHQEAFSCVFETNTSVLCNLEDVGFTRSESIPFTSGDSKNVFSPYKWPLWDSTPLHRQKLCVG